MLTVHTVIEKEKQIDEAAREILEIYQKFTHAHVNQALSHHWEKHDTAVERVRDRAAWKQSVEDESQ